MKNLFLSCFLLMAGLVMAQEMPITYQFGEKQNDRHRYSNLVTIAEDGDGGLILVRSYFAGLILKPKGYLIERYDKDLNLISEYNYKFKDMQLIDGFVKNGTLNLIFFNYDYNKGQYEYWVHKTATTNINFTTERIYEIKTKVVNGAFGKNYYNRDFSNGFSTTLLFNKEKTGFVISTHHSKGKEETHTLQLFDTDLKKRWEVDFNREAEEKNYAFEQLALTNDLSKAYIVGKAYFKQRRFKQDERKYQYELLKVDGAEVQTQQFTTPGNYPEALYPIITGSNIKCVGFYADRKDNRYNGISYYNLNASDLTITEEKHHPFSDEFMFDKFGRDDDRVIKNLVFKEVTVTAENDILFNAEEYFVTNSMYSTGAGQRMKVERFHYNDIMSAKLKANGDLHWIRNINKAEVTQGDGAYASYSSYTKDGNTYFFICTAAENPQLINQERLIFRQGLTQNKNVFAIALDKDGKLSYEKIIDSKEARLPLMVSMPLRLTQQDAMYFYAKRGSKKQMVKVAF